MTWTPPEKLLVVMDPRDGQITAYLPSERDDAEDDAACWRTTLAEYVRQDHP